jgi:hypothetical protein
MRAASRDTPRIFEIPTRHELAIEEWMDSNDAIFLLDAAEDDVARRTLTTTASPSDGVRAQTIAKILRVDAIKDRLQIEVPTFVY